MKQIGEINYALSLTPAERSVVTGLSKPMIKDLKTNEVEVCVVQAMATVLAIKGLKDVSETEQDFIIDYVTKTLKESFSTYRTAEIQQACELWAKGELFSDKDLNQLSAENIFKAIHRFNEKIRREAIHKQKQHEEKAAKEADLKLVEERKAKFEADILELYKSFPKGFKMQNKGSMAAVYRHLDSKGLIKISNSRKWEIHKNVLKIKDRTKWMKKGFLEITAKELSEYRALYEVFAEWKDFEYDLESKLKITLTP
jgi:hypothetical protein